jgi:NADH:ubiquinone oxidoreductase subunit 6 (subunit J)
MATRRNVALAGAFLLLVALVAVAARGHAPAGNGATHGLDSKLIWEFVLLAFLALFIISFPVAAWVVLTTRLETSARAQKRRSRAVKRVFVFLTLLLIAVVVTVLRADTKHPSKPKPILNNPGEGGPVHGRGNPGNQIPFDWLPAIVILSIAVVGAVVVAYIMFRKPPRRQPTPEELALQLSELLDDSLDDLRAERDPRRAVIATYARMESTLAGAGFPRDAAETPLEFLGRVLRDLLHTSAEAVQRLTALFERAKFSTHEIDGRMKNDAINALVAVRDELRAVAL